MHIRPARVDSFLKRLDSDPEFRDAFLAFLNRCAEFNHAVNNPLTGLLGFTELLLDTDLTPTQRSYLMELSICATRIGNEAEEVSRRKEKLIADFDFVEYFERVPTP